jgi:resorcinol 4-hydroxylase (FADH2)
MLIIFNAGSVLIAPAVTFSIDATRSKYRSNAAYAGQLAYDTARKVWDLAGARAVYTNNDIGRIFLDILVATRHVTQNLEINATDHGRARVNLPLTNPAL